MESQRVKQLQYLGRMAEQAGGFQATAVIMEVRPHSMAVELEPWMIRGWIRAASLPGGRYWFDAPLNRLVCRDGGRGRRDAYRLGDRLQVKVARIDLHELQVDFEVVA
jgi:ribonuclease R